MELSWSDSEIPLEQFLERFKLPQIVQIGDGIYGRTEEETLSRGQELHLHLLKDTNFYWGITKAGDEMHIPLNSPHKVLLHLEKSIEVYDSTTKIDGLFPQKYKHVRLQSSQKDPSDHTKIIEAGEIVETLFFDKDIERLVCIDNQGCEITLKLSDVKVIEKSKEGAFLAEVHQNHPLPLTVEFEPQTSSSVHLHRGLIDLRKIIVKQTVMATSRDEECKSVLTFPRDLDVTVIPPDEKTLQSAEYRSLCENPNIHVDFDKVKESIEKDEEIYDDVKSCMVKAIPYAEAFFGKYIADNKDEERDEDGYIVMEKLDKPSLVKPGTSNNEKKKNPITNIARKLQSRVSASRLSSPTSPTSSKSPTSTTLPRVPMSPTSPTSLSLPKSPTSPTANKGKDSDDDDDVYLTPLEKKSSSFEQIYQERFDQTRKNIIKSNRKPEDLTVEDVKALLQDLNLSQYGPQFQSEQVDGKMLKDLDKEMLQSHFNMTPFHALKLTKATVDNWRPTITDST